MSRTWTRDPTVCFEVQTTGPPNRFSGIRTCTFLSSPVVRDDVSTFDFSPSMKPSITAIRMSSGKDLKAVVRNPNTGLPEQGEGYRVLCVLLPAHSQKRVSYSPTVKRRVVFCDGVVKDCATQTL